MLYTAKLGASAQTWPVGESLTMRDNRWWRPGEDDLDWDVPLPEVIELAP